MGLLGIRAMIYRTYGCDDCGATFEVAHESSNDPYPDCPNCSKVLEWRPKSFAIGGSSQSKAVDLTQKIMEQDYGLTNFKDNNKEGDVGYIAPRKTTAEVDVQMQRDSEAGREVVKRLAEVQPQHKQQVDSFFGGQMATIGQNQVPVQQLIAAGKTGPGAGVDPMKALHTMGKQGKLPTPKIMAKADMTGKIIG